MEGNSTANRGDAKGEDLLRAKRAKAEIIRRAVWLYARFTLSYRDVEDLLAERGLDISYESVRRWFLKFGAPIARNLRHTRPHSQRLLAS